MDLPLRLQTTSSPLFSNSISGPQTTRVKGCQYVDHEDDVVLAMLVVEGGDMMWLVPPHPHIPN
jgi:NAD/NADP transhydrogenase alpha subunit